MEKVLKTMINLLKFMIKTLTKVVEKGNKIIMLYKDSEPKIAKVMEVIATLEDIIKKLQEKKAELEQTKGR